MPVPSAFRDRIRQEIDRELKDLVARIVESFPVEQIILFGSAARGDVHEASDIDLVIIMETEADFFSRATPIRDLYRGHRTLEVLVYTPSEWEQMLAEGRDFARQVVEAGRVVHCKPQP